MRYVAQFCGHLFFHIFCKIVEDFHWSVHLENMNSFYKYQSILADRRSSVLSIFCIFEPMKNFSRITLAAPHHYTLLLTNSISSNQYFSDRLKFVRKISLGNRLEKYPGPYSPDHNSNKGASISIFYQPFQLIVTPNLRKF